MRKLVLKKSKCERLQEIFNEYLKVHRVESAHLMDVAAWAQKKGYMELSHTDTVRQFARELAQAARMEVYEDPQGRKVRKKHAVHQVVEENGKRINQYLWADIEDATPDHMKLSLQQRRQYIVGDCKQLKTDMDSFNQNNKYGAQLLLSLDFTEDVAELEMPTDYQPE
jgi:hypothetical protein